MSSTTLTSCDNIFIVKLQSKVQTSVLGLGVDFVLPLSQQEEQEEQEEEPHQNIPEGNILEVLNLAKSLTKPNQTHATPLLTLTLLPPPPPPDINPALQLKKKVWVRNCFCCSRRARLMSEGLHEFGLVW